MPTLDPHSDDTDFSLAGTSTSFTSRASDIFASLSTLTEPHFAIPHVPPPPSAPARHTPAPVERSDREDTRDHQHRPKHNHNHHRHQRRRRMIADSIDEVNDDNKRWRRYDLSDVDITADNNQQIAVRFRDSLIKEGDDDGPVGTPSDIPARPGSKVTFSRPKARERDSGSGSGDKMRSTGFGNSKLMMAEHKVGVAKPKRKKMAPAVVDQGGTADKKVAAGVNLGHLLDGDDDDDSDQ